MDSSETSPPDAEWEILSTPAIRQNKLSEEDQAEYSKAIRSKHFAKCVELMINLVTAYKELSLQKSTGNRAKLTKVEDKIHDIKQKLVKEQKKLSEQESICWIAWEEIEAIGKRHCGKLNVDTVIIEKFWEEVYQENERFSKLKGFIKATANVFGA